MLCEIGGGGGGLLRINHVLKMDLSVYICVKHFHIFMHTYMDTQKYNKLKEIISVGVPLDT